MKKKVFLDSGVFIAFLNRRDQWHPKVTALFSNPKVKWYTSLLVYSETYSWFLHRMGEESARQFARFFETLSSLQLLEATKQHHQSTLTILNRFRGSKLTYVDASSLALMSKHQIKTVWSTDHHLSLAGAEVLPRLP